MNIFDSLIEAIENLDDPISYATRFSNIWKTRASYCKKDILSTINKVKSRLENLVDEEEIRGEEIENRGEEREKKINVLMDDIFLLTSYAEELDILLEKYKVRPLPHEAVEKITFYENEIYKRIVSQENLNTINEEIDLEERRLQVINDLITKVDSMWDEGVSEQEIKTYIFTNLKKLFTGMSETQIRSMTISLYSAITRGKNVRIHLTEEQISKIKRGKCEGTCGTCLEEINKEEEVMILPCKEHHPYHSNCILPWLKMSVYCPTCKTDLRGML